jgi:predicted metalloprotease with PDZ domain
MIKVRLSIAMLVSVLSAANAQQIPIQIHADLTDAPRKIYRADIDIPVHRGPLDLISPEWIPGAHGPDGPIVDITGIRFEVDGRAIPWHRDSVDTYEYHLEIPAGVSMLHAHVDCIYSRATRVTATLEWEDLMLYPAHTPVREISIQPTVTVPSHWGIGTSLKPLNVYDPQHPAGGTIQYAATTVEMLEDSPVMSGLYFHEYDLAPGVSPPHFLDLIGPTPASVEAHPEAIEQMSRVVREGLAMYGPPHYTDYHFLVLLRKNTGGGLEHHQSSDNTMETDFFSGYKSSVGLAGVLPHEFAHSWNGKYRRPDGLSTPDFATPMQNNLLWVYEGLTNYLGDLMGERVGMVTAEQYRQYLALTAAEQDAHSGRAWRSVEDTTFDSAMPRNGGGRGEAWSNWKRGTDYYPEGSLFWLDVDTTIRQRTQDKKSLRDFLQIFLQKGGSGVVRVEPYTLHEIIADLNLVVVNDWGSFIQTRLYEVQPHVNTEGIEQSGYRLEYTSDPTPEMAQALKENPPLASWFSIGLSENGDGTIQDVRVGSAADKAGFAPGQKIIAVNGQVFTIARLHAAISGAKGKSVPIQCTVQDEDTIATLAVSYSDGLLYPRLSRNENMPDLLTEILTPQSSPISDSRH